MRRAAFLHLKAAEGTTIDIYGFENYYRREIDFTIGLNNGIRYVTSEGWQTYECMVRTECATR